MKRRTTTQEVLEALPVVVEVVRNRRRIPDVVEVVVAEKILDEGLPVVEVATSILPVTPLQLINAASKVVVTLTSILKMVSRCTSLQTVITRCESYPLHGRIRNTSV
jgi:hypothetical protein